MSLSWVVIKTTDDRIQNDELPPPVFTNEHIDHLFQAIQEGLQFMYYLNPGCYDAIDVIRAVVVINSPITSNSVAQCGASQIVELAIGQNDVSLQTKQIAAECIVYLANIGTI